LTGRTLRCICCRGAPIRELWRQRGYDAGRHDDAWQVEFELRPSLLRELRVDGQSLPTDPDALLTDHLDAVWSYLTTSWLTLHDRTRAAARPERAPVAPWVGCAPTAPRPPRRHASGARPHRDRDRTRRGDRDRLLRLALGAVAGVAALDGSADPQTALLVLTDFAREQGGDEALAVRTDRARARYGLPTRSAARPRTLLPDALPELADAA